MKLEIERLKIYVASEEPYVLHLVENAQGAFVGEVWATYQAVLDRIGEACGEHGSFHGAYVEELLRYVQETYGDEIEYWYTVCLDGSVPMLELQRRIDESFELSHPKKRFGS